MLSGDDNNQTVVVVVYCECPTMQSASSCCSGGAKDFTLCRQKEPLEEHQLIESSSSALEQSETLQV